MFEPKKAGIINERPIQMSFVNGAPRANALKIWSSRAKPPAKAISTTF